ncbi:hypothetical protein [Variovorax sp. HW608]|uniref:hypothetical protein n=1 Tax=Variovorax sp. HW608 TaxID=1034889 RepID=UPI0026C267F7
MRLFVAGEPHLANGIVGAGGVVEWKASTRPGDVLHVESEVLELIPSRSRPERGGVVLRSKTVTRRGDVVQVSTAKLMATRRTSS